VVEKLSVGAVLEAGGGGEEVVARMMVDHDKVDIETKYQWNNFNLSKVKTLVQQIISLEAWREEVKE